jgi:hypothetical protein
MDDILVKSHRRKVLANFLATIPDNKGWWYRLPKLNNNNKISEEALVDLHLPNMGVLFGLTEDALALVLVQMGLLQSDGITIIRKGWDDLKAMFGLNPKLEVERTRLLYAGRRLNHWYVRLGTCTLTPHVIFRCRLYPPKSLVTRTTTKFVTNELVSILKTSNMFTQLLQTDYYFKGLPAGARKRGQGAAINSTESEEDNSENSSDDNAENSSDDAENLSDEDESSACSVYDITKGTAADKKQFPCLAKFNIPINNPQTISSLLCELLKAQEQIQGNNQDANGILLKNPANPSQSHLYVQVPTGTSKAAHVRFGRTITKMVNWRAKRHEDKEEIERKSVSHALRALERLNPDTFLQVAQERGYSIQQTPKISANYWLAMSTAAGLRVRQQRIVNKYLMYHFGDRVCVSEKDITEVGSNFVEFKKESIEVNVQEYGVKKVQVSWRDLFDLFEHYAPELFEGGCERIDRIEILLGGDHGKGAMTFLAVLIVRYQAKKNPKIIELQIGQVDSSKDTMELLRTIVARITPGISRLKPKDGISSLHVTKQDDQYTIRADDNPPAQPENTAQAVKLEFFLVGDMKFLFMMLGRSGYSGSNCLYCKLNSKQWKTKHVTEEHMHCGAEEWSIEKLLAPFLASQIARQAAGGTLEASPDDGEELPGQKEAPLWTFIPIKNVLVPLLHILLGLGNDLLDNFWSSWFDERVEVLKPDESEARHMALLAEIAVEEYEEKFESLKGEVNALVTERIQLNSTLNENGLEAEVVGHLNEQKNIVLQTIEHKTRERDSVKIELTKRRSSKRGARKAERELRLKRGKMEKPFRVYVEMDIFPKYKVYMSSYHGGNMEGPAVRRLMIDAKEVFEEIGNFVKESLGAEEQRSKEIAGDLEIDQVCGKTASLFLLLDSVFSYIYGIRGKATEEQIVILEQRLLQVLYCDWRDAGMSFTPKFHTLLDHLLEQIRRVEGFVIMGEDRIERSHQTRAAHADQLLRLRNKTKLMDTQAKLQNVALVKEISDIQEEVSTKTKRVLKRQISPSPFLD